MKPSHTPDASKVSIVEAEFRREGHEGVVATFAGRPEFAEAIRVVLSRKDTPVAVPEPAIEATE